MEVAIAIIIVGILVTFYFLPTIIALNKSHPSKSSIVKINVFLGWSGVFWLVAFFKSLSNRELNAKHEEELRITNANHERDMSKLITHYEEGLSKINRAHEEELGMLSEQHGNETRRINAEHKEISAGYEEKLRRIDRKYREYNGEALYIVDPHQFERIVAETLRRLNGYEEVEIIKRSEREGVDIKAYRRLKSEPRTSIIVQCKLYPRGGIVEHSHVRDLIGSMAIHGAGKAYMVTTSDFSERAYDEAFKGKLRGRVVLVNGGQFNLLRRKNGLAPILHLGEKGSYAANDIELGDP